MQPQVRTPARVNISEVVANSSFGGFQLGLCILCGLCLIMDGFDVQAMGYVAPVILKEWHVPNAQFGPGIRRRAVRHFGRFAAVQHAGG